MFLTTLDHNSKSFTLIELLVVIAILAVLMSVVVITINPAEMLKKTRDTSRISDLTTLTKAISLYQTSNPDASLGVYQKVYVSLPANNTNCSDLNLPPLPTGYSYQCVTNDNLRKINGTGWLPLNLANISTGAPVSNLPVDPKNTVNDNLYYTFYCNSLNQYILTDYVESTAYGPKGTSAITNKDGGSDSYIYEVGNNLFISPLKPVGSWSFDEGSGTVAVDSSGNNNNGTLINGPTWTTGQVNNALSFDGSDDYVKINLSPTLPKDFVNKGEWSFEIWAWRASDAPGSSDLFHGNAHQPRINYNNSGVRIAGYINGTYTTILFTPSPGDENWNQFVFQQSASQNKTEIWINGQLKASGSFMRIDGNAAHYLLSCNWDSNSWWKGKMDEIHIYNRALSDQEIKRHYEESK